MQAARRAVRALSAVAGLLLLAPTVTGSAPAARAGGIADPNSVVRPSPLPLQPIGRPFVDPAFGTTLRRVSDASARGGFETHVYSQLQAFSSDNAYLLLIDAGSYLVRRTSDLTRIGGLNTAGWNAPRWHPRRPHVLVHFDTNADNTVRLQYTNVDTRVTTDVFRFPRRYVRVRVNQSFDELSDDGRWLAGMLTRDDGRGVIFALDTVARRLGALLAIPDLYAGPCRPDPRWGEVEPDWIGVSPLGRYLVVQWPRDGTTRCSGLETFDLRSGRFVGRVYDGHQHGDLGVLPDGRTEFFMTFELGHPSGNLAVGIRRLPGTRTASRPSYLRAMSWDIGGHVSCRGRAGACLVTAGSDPGNGWSPLEGELFIMRTDGAVARLAHHRSTACGYWVQPRASISRDGRYVVFASDWGRRLGCQDGGLGRGDPYLLDLQVAPAR